MYSGNKTLLDAYLIFPLNCIFVSVIIPVFNASAYIGDCIQSLLQQTLHNIEIIIVNDGSTDNSKKIIESFSTIDNRIVFLDGPNEGVSAARNKGIKIARGEFIGFVDADDWVAPEMYKKMYSTALAQTADCVICNVQINVACQASQLRLKLTNETIQLKQHHNSEMRKLMQFNYDFANWNKIYSCKIIQQNQLSFQEGLQVFEDLLFNCCYFQFSTAIAVLNEPYYNYRVHANSVMSNSKHNEIEEYNKLYCSFHAFCKSRNVNSGLNEFDIEMRRGFYYAVIPRVVTQLKISVKSGKRRINQCSQLLQCVDKGLFNYTNEEIGKGMQAFLKRLLKKGKYTSFSIFKFIRTF